MKAFLCSKALKDKSSKSDPSCSEIDDRHFKKLTTEIRLKIQM
jgi:hypothetical protein